MKTLAIACLLVVAVTLAECARIRRDDKYTTRYDNINIDEILSNDRVLKNYIKLAVTLAECARIRRDVNIDDVLTNDRLLKKFIKCLLEQGSCTVRDTELKSK
ncbi:hypothetical protein C0J52_25415 [Blattella germanica]|nr:hypothetical protein C0J52_25415 [Blattella germanica]